MDYCSPLALENVSAKQFSCLSYDKLVELLKAWNDVHPKKEHIPFPKKPTIENVYAGLKKAFMKKNIEKEADWVTYLQQMLSKISTGTAASTAPVKKEISDGVKKIKGGITPGAAAKKADQLKLIRHESFRPDQPPEWQANPITWLTNFDIDDVMEQYEKVKKNQFKYFGALPADFYKQPDYCDSGMRSNGGTVKCDIPLKNLIQRKIYNMGFVLNFDKHDQGGSHWTSIFACLKPDNKMYGIYFYNSTTGAPPKDIKDFIDHLKAEVDKLNLSKPINIYKNTKQHQYKNTECGVFSIYFITQALRAFKGLKKWRDWCDWCYRCTNISRHCKFNHSRRRHD